MKNKIQQEQDKILDTLLCETDYSLMNHLYNISTSSLTKGCYVILNHNAEPCYRGYFGQIRGVIQEDQKEALFKVVLLTNHAEVLTCPAYQLTIIDDKGPTPPAASKIIYNGPKTIVFWEDGSKTIVSCSEEDAAVGGYSHHAGFCAALAKKIYGSTSRVKKVIDKIGKEYNNHG